MKEKHFFTIPLTLDRKNVKRIIGKNIFIKKYNPASQSLV